MKGMLAVAQREIVERRMWLVAAAAAGLLPLLVPVLPWVEAGNAADARNLLALVLGVTLLSTSALGFGGTMIARELAERRLGFYFARPLSGSAIWWGKLLASFLVALTSGALVLLPSAMLGGRQALRLFGVGGDHAWLPAAGAGVIVIVLCLAHFVTIATRSRLPLVALDLGMLGVLTLTSVLALRRFFWTGATSLFTWSLVTVLLVVLVALVAGGWAQVVVGRCDIRRGHVALSVTLWGILGVLTLALVAYSAFVFAAAPRSLRVVDALSTAPRGGWVSVVGRSRWRGDYRPAFQLDVETGAWLRSGQATEWWEGSTYSADGSRAVWTRATGPTWRAPVEVMTLDLTTRGAQPEATSLILSRDEAWSMVIAPDGRHLALAGDKTLSVYTLPGGALVRAVSLPAESGRRSLQLVSPGALRLALWPPGKWGGAVTISLWHLDIAGGHLMRTGEVSGVDYWDSFFMPEDPRRELQIALSREPSGNALTLHDAATGARLATLTTYTGVAHRTVGFLRDGRILVGEAGGSTPARVRILSRDGKELAAILLGNAGRIWLGAEVVPGRLAVGLATSEGWAVRGGLGRIVDLATGTVHPLPDGHVPVGWFGWGSHHSISEPGSAVARLFRTPEGALALYDPAADTFRTVLDTRWEN